MRYQVNMIPFDMNEQDVVTLRCSLAEDMLNDLAAKGGKIVGYSPVVIPLPAPRIAIKPSELKYRKVQGVAVITEHNE